jgi:hypothetical protein
MHGNYQNNAVPSRSMISSTYTAQVEFAFVLHSISLDVDANTVELAVLELTLVLGLERFIISLSSVKWWEARCVLDSRLIQIQTLSGRLRVP